MVTYVSMTPTRGDYLDDVAVLNGQVIHVEDNAPIKTGLLDAAGHPLYRLPERTQLGFIKATS